MDWSEPYLKLEQNNMEPISDWASPSIKLEHLHKRLDHCLNLNQTSEAYSILIEMQTEILKLQKFVLYCLDES